MKEHRANGVRASVVGLPPRARLLVVLSALACGACTPVKRSAPPHAQLGGGVVASVGDARITAEAVGRVAAAQRVPTERALAELIEDALFATQARLDGPSGAILNVKRTVLARLVLERLSTDARDKGAPSDSEVEEQSAKRWWELERPAGARTVHALIRVKNDGERAKAQALALQLRLHLEGISDADQFIAAAKAFDARGLELVTEKLPATAMDGTLIPSQAPAPGARRNKLVPEFARAANSLTAPGGLSPVVETPYGFHVILLLERTPPHVLPLEERRVAVTQDVFKARADRAFKALLGRLRATADIEVMRAAQDISGQIKVSQ